MWKGKGRERDGRREVSYKLLTLAPPLSFHRKPLFVSSVSWALSPGPSSDNFLSVLCLSFSLKSHRERERSDTHTQTQIHTNTQIRIEREIKRDVEIRRVVRRRGEDSGKISFPLPPYGPDVLPPSGQRRRQPPPTRRPPRRRRRRKQSRRRRVNHPDGKLRIQGRRCWGRRRHRRARSLFCFLMIYRSIWFDLAVKQTRMCLWISNVLACSFNEWIQGFIRDFFSLSPVDLEINLGFLFLCCFGFA